MNRSCLLPAFLIFLGLQALVILPSFQGAISRGEQSWWIGTEVAHSYSKFGLLDAALAAYTYIIFYLSIVTIVAILAAFIFEYQIRPRLGKPEEKPVLTARDPFFQDLPLEQIDRYQEIVDELLAAVDITNNTKWACGLKDYDKNLLDRDSARIADIIQSKVNSSGFSGTFLHVLINQYFFADVLERERDRTHWVRRVLSRNDEDYFPSGERTYQLLLMIGEFS